jgi:hypothetical protein
MAVGSNEIKVGFYLGLGLIAAGLLWALVTGLVVVLKDTSGG